MKKRDPWSVNGVNISQPLLLFEYGTYTPDAKASREEVAVE